MNGPGDPPVSNPFLLRLMQQLDEQRRAQMQPPQMRADATGMGPNSAPVPASEYAQDAGYSLPGVFESFARLPGMIATLPGMLFPTDGPALRTTGRGEVRYDPTQSPAGAPIGRAFEHAGQVNHRVAGAATDALFGAPESERERNLRETAAGVTDFVGLDAALLGAGAVGSAAHARRLAQLAEARKAARVSPLLDARYGDSFLKPGDADLIAHLRSQTPDVSHFTMDDLRDQLGATRQRLTRFVDAPVSAAESEVAIAHDETYLNALQKEWEKRRAAGHRTSDELELLGATPGPRRRSGNMPEDPGMTGIGLDPHGNHGLLPGGPEQPAPTGGRTLIKGGLSKDDAVALNKQMQKEGKPTTMQRNPDGTFDVWQKGAGAKGPREDIGVVKEKVVEAPKKSLEEQKAELIGVSMEDVEFSKTAQQRLEAISDEYHRASNDYNNPNRQQELDRLSAEYSEVQKRKELIEQDTRFLRDNPQATLEEVEQYSAMLRERRRLDLRAEKLNKLHREGKYEGSPGLTEEELDILRNNSEDYNRRYKLSDEMSNFSEKIQQRVANEAKNRAAEAHTERFSEFQRQQERGVDPNAFRHDLVAPDVTEKKPFMSRAYNVVKSEYKDAGALRPDEWLDLLKKDGRFSPQEVDFLEDMMQGGKESHFSEALILPEEMAELIKRRGPVGKLDLIVQAKRQAADPTGTVPLNYRETPLEPKNIQEFVPDARENYYGQPAVREELQTVFENLASHIDDQVKEGIYRGKVADQIKSRQANLDSFVKSVDDIFGKSVGRRFMKYLKEHPLQIKDADGTVLKELDFIPSERQLRDAETRTDWLENYEEFGQALNERMEEFFGPDYGYYGPEQLTLQGEETYNAEAGQWEPGVNLRPELSSDDRYYRRRELRGAQMNTRAAGRLEDQIAEKSFDDYDIRDELYNDVYGNPGDYLPPPSEEDIMRIARDAQQRDLDIRNRQPLPMHDKTQFQQYQRINNLMPYEELTIYTPGTGIHGGHFNNATDLAAHARTEFHNGYEGANRTQILMESQSDYAKKMTEQRRRVKKSTSAVEEKKSPWESGGVYNRANVAAAMYRGALKDMEWFSWSSPLNRNRRAHLHADPATRGYGREIPEWVQKVYDHLGEPVQVEYWTPQHSTDVGGYANPEGWLPGDQQFIRVKVSKEMREKIKRGGIAALGLGSFVLGGKGYKQKETQ